MVSKKYIEALKSTRLTKILLDPDEDSRFKRLMDWIFDLESLKRKEVNK